MPAVQRSRRWAAGIPILLALALSALFWPGLLSSDSQTIFEESKTFNFGSGHPPVMGIIWGLLNKLHEGPELMLLAQIAIFVAAMWMLVSALFRGIPSRTLAAVVLLGSPMVASILGVLWKDIWCTAFIGIASALTLSQWQNSRFCRANLVLVVASLYFALLFRPNAVGAVVAILGGQIALGLRLRKPGLRTAWRRIVAFIAALPLSAGLMVGADQFDRIFVPGGVPSWTVYFFDIAGTIMHSPDPAALSREIETRHPMILRKGGKLHDRLLNSYLPYSCVTLNPDWGNPDAPFVLPMTHENTPEFKAVRRELISRYPASYIAYRAEYFQYLLGFYQTPGAGRNGWVLADLRSWKNAHAARYVSSVENTWFMAPVIWLVACMLASLILLAPDRVRNESGTATNEGVGWVALSAIGVTAVLFLAGPAPDYRYMFWPTSLGILLSMWMATRFLVSLLAGPSARMPDPA